MMEKLTQDMADAAWEIIEEVEAMGGMTRAVDSGWAKLKIEAAAAEKQARIDSGKDVIVGVNKYRLDKEDPLEIREVDNVMVREQQIARLKADPGAARRRHGAGGAGRADRPPPTRATATCSTSASRPCACAPPWARFRDALEKVFGRHRADTQKVTGVYAAAYDSAEGWEKLKAEIDGLRARRRAAARA